MIEHDLHAPFIVLRFFATGDKQCYRIEMSSEGGEYDVGKWLTLDDIFVAVVQKKMDVLVRPEELDLRKK